MVRSLGQLGGGELGNSRHGVQCRQAGSFIDATTTDTATGTTGTSSGSRSVYFAAFGGCRDVGAGGVFRY